MSRQPDLPIAFVAIAGKASDLQRFGQLLRDRRSAQGWSRQELGRRAKLSEATIKFIETARHLASRATLIRLVAIAELRLCWADVPPPRSRRQRHRPQEVWPFFAGARWFG
jgi:transcriptional regulator with XRE-family HTH domain